MAMAQERGAPVLLERGFNVSPIAIAPAIFADGRVERTGEWTAYAGAGQRGAEVVFDCYDHTGNCGGSGYYYFGTAFSTGFATDDMTVTPDTDIAAGAHRANFAWYWGCNGADVQTCIVGLFTQESTPAECEADSGDYSGWLLNYGTLTCNPGGYYSSDVDLTGTGTWPLPSDGSGSYVFGFLDDINNWTTDGYQMFWGTGDARGDPNAPGIQVAERLDDDNPVDGFHSVPTECYTYNTGGQTCPDPLGGVMGFWGVRGGPCDAADCDGNGIIDTRDFSCFFNLFVPRDPAADCDGNGVVDTRDFTCFLNIWNSCR
jgi:hypothetical protein